MTFKILAIGDVIGKPGRSCLSKMLPYAREQFNPDIVIANGENAAGGFGITKKIYQQFIENFELYRKVPTITHHCQPMADFVPPLSSFDQVYTFEQLNQVCAEIGERTGRELTLPHSQSGGPKLNAQMLSEQSFERLLQIYDADYRLLEGIYERPKFDALTYKPV